MKDCILKCGKYGGRNLTVVYNDIREDKFFIPLKGQLKAGNKC